MSRYSVYVAGPIRGYDDGNRSSFYEAGAYIDEYLNWLPIIPHEVPPWRHEGKCPVDALPGNEHKPHSDCCYLRGDLVELLACDGIVLLPRWEHSVGARLEFSVASHCGIEVYYWDPAGSLLRGTDGRVVRPS